MIEAHADKISACGILSELELKSKGYVLVTLHRAENVDLPERLSALLEGIARVAKAFNVPAIISAHPRLRARMESAESETRLLAPILAPFWFFRLPEARA